MVSSPLGAPGWDFPSGWKPDPQAPGRRKCLPQMWIEKGQRGSQPGIPARVPDSCKATEPGAPKGPGARLPWTQPLGKAQRRRGHSYTLWDRFEGWPPCDPAVPALSLCKSVLLFTACFCRDQGLLVGKWLVSGWSGFELGSFCPQGPGAFALLPCIPQADTSMGIISLNP